MTTLINNSYFIFNLFNLQYNYIVTILSIHTLIRIVQETIINYKK